MVDFMLCSYHNKIKKPPQTAKMSIVFLFLKDVVFVSRNCVKFIFVFLGFSTVHGTTVIVCGA